MKDMMGVDKSIEVLAGQFFYVVMCYFYVRPACSWKRIALSNLLGIVLLNRVA